jgi:hypothetical protein
MANGHDDGMRRELGLTRRDLIRRGAVVGGTLLWATPVIQSIQAPPAFAAGSAGGPIHGCCRCKVRPEGPGGVKLPKCAADDFTQATCDNYCSTPAGKNSVKEFKQGTMECHCIAPSSGPCSCTDKP